MKLVTVDTSTSAFSVALTIDGRLAAEYVAECEKTLSDRLLAAIDAVLSDRRLSVEELDGFGVALGPGSFTGVRIGVATVKGLALATGKPVAGFSSLAMLALNLPFSSHPVCPLFDARKKEVYAGLYMCGALPEPLAADRVISPARLLEELSGQVLFLGDGALRYREFIETTLGARALFAPSHCHLPRAAAGAALAQKILQGGSSVPLASLNPSYIRPSEAELARLKHETL